MDKDFLSLESFKKWMSEQKNPFNEKRTSRLIGLKVETKLRNTRRLAKNIIEHDGDIDEIAADFKENGGIILEVDEKCFIVEVDSGTFKIHRCFVKKS